MREIQVRTPAKVNLTLDVVGKRDDGYHSIESVFQAVGIYDALTLTRVDTPGITLSSTNKYLPCNQKNIAYQAAQLFLKRAHRWDGIHIHIEKHIPSQAGLGGGSSDGAAVIAALNWLLGCRMSLQEQCEIAAQVGADVPFFLTGGTMHVSGMGEILEPLPPMPALPMVIAKGKAGVSTPEAYRRIEQLTDPVHPDTARVIDFLRNGQYWDAIPKCGNLFEAATNLEEVTQIKQIMMDMGAQCALMTGSGSAVFGIFDTGLMAQKCCNALHAVVPYAVTCKTLKHSIRIVSRS